MTPEEIAEILEKKFPGSLVDRALNTDHPSLVVAADKWREIALFLRDEPAFRMNFCRCVSGVDRPADEIIEVIYDLMSVVPAGRGEWKDDNVVAVKIRVARDGGRLPSVAGVWPAAEWHEREVYDMFGVTFDGHPDLRRILCPDDWVGYPLRKDYEYPLEYHGIPGTTEYGQKSPRH